MKIGFRGRGAWALLGVVWASTFHLGLAKADLPADVDAVVQSYVARHEFSGTVLVAKQGQMILRKAYGFADRDSGRLNEESTRFTLASVTKPLTATLILQLVDQGRLRLDDPISPYLPGAPGSWSGIQIKHLLSHTSGIIDFLNTDSILDPIRNLALEPAQIMDHFKDLPLLFVPGTSLSYSNSGYLLLGMILEKVTGTPYSQLIRQNLFNLAGMTSSGIMGIDNASVTDGNFALGFLWDATASQWVDPPRMNPKILFGLGNVYSTVDDLYSFDQSLYSTRLLSENAKEAMFTPNFGRYGYGFSFRTVDGHRTFFHEGNVGGFSNRLSRYPDDHVTIILLGNLRQGKITELNYAIAAKVL